MNTFRIVVLAQKDGTFYGGLHVVGHCRGCYGFPSRDLAWSWAWDQQQQFVRALQDRLEEDDGIAPEAAAAARRSLAKERLQ